MQLERRRTRRSCMGFWGIAVLLSSTGACSAPFSAESGADQILIPARRPPMVTDVAHTDVSLRTADGLTLRGWLFPSQAKMRRGLMIYLHGIGDDRRGAIDLAARFGPKGYDILGYDSRGHGESEGRYCTYGYFEKRDVQAALDSLHAPSAILFGSSLGASVALQAAAVEPRVRGVVAQSPFSDLDTIVRERAPELAPRSVVDAALDAAGKRAGFPPSDVSPLADAPRIQVPVLLIHGAADSGTAPAHSERLYAQLRGLKQLLIVPGKGHLDVLDDEAVWAVIARWLDGLSP
jgi:uncharacterized protein